MVKSQQPERVFIVTNIISSSGTKKLLPEDGPPKIPPRMKKKGPALPEKPPHMRATPPSQPLRDPLRPRSNMDNRQTTDREVLVAATRGVVREKPVEKRQREPAKLLMPTSGGGGLTKKDFLTVTLEDCLGYKTTPTTTMMRKSSTRPPPQPVLLIPRGMVNPWGSAPAVSYALWVQRDGVTTKGAMSPRREVLSQPRAIQQKSGSVTRSGSLTSQGSSSSDSGNEAFPKSVLKKHKRQSSNNNNTKGVLVNNNSNNHKKQEHKKNVTFNAFATVQLMEE
ncbi:hypothetical protein JTE90_023173 [Oedothorax gibbosus]|uniref:Uncharacterized protein n=1 Tax=Oedothorax gibbosus TaxID=931172 RepID=A0AAV6UI27_9ARAC|nr:hypothetical protein JTE90_023173 [Oedothorax gibbosus]